MFGQRPRQTGVRELLPAQLLEREIAGGEVHRYVFELQKDEFLKVQVEQKGIDVLLLLNHAKGDEMGRMDSPNGNKGFEVLSFVADSAGRFVLEIKCLDPQAGRGAYTIQREPSRIATADDRNQVALERELQAKREVLGVLVVEVPKLIEGMNSSTSPETVQQALSKARQGLELAQGIKVLDYESLFLFLTARVYEETRDHQRAVEYFEKTLQAIRS